MSHLPSRVTYLVAGAGPSGLALSTALLNNGVPTSALLQIDKWTARRPRVQSRATGLQPLALEMIQRHIDDPTTAAPDPRAPRGKSAHVPADADPDAVLPERIHSLSQVLIDNGRQVRTMRIRHARSKGACAVNLNYSLFAGETPYPYLNTISQTVVEEAFEIRLETLGGQVHRGWALEAFEHMQDAGESYYECHLSHVETGQKVVVWATYLIGADGGKSVVRRLAGISFEGTMYPETFVLGDFSTKGDTWPWTNTELGYDEHEYSVIIGEHGLMMFIPIPGARMRMAASIHGAAADAFKPAGLDAARLDEDGHLEDSVPPSLAEIAAIIDARGPGARPEIDLLWSSRYRIQHRVAGAFRAGDVFLVGDAAHVHSPSGAQGLNVGVLDAITLALVLAKAPREGMQAELDAWAKARLEIAKQVIATTDGLTRMATVSNPYLGWFRDRGLDVMGKVPGMGRKLAFQLACCGTTTLTP